jgi:cephalosporin hydroxylase
MFKRISMIQGPNVDPEVIEQVQARTDDKGRISACVNSNHTREHVRTELRPHAPLASIARYRIVFDTAMEDSPAEMFRERPGESGSIQIAAVRGYLRTYPEFEIDKQIDYKLLISVTPDSYLKRIA